MRSKLYDLLPNEGAGNLGVDKAVAHDQDVDECLPKGASVLHLPYSLLETRKLRSRCMLLEISTVFMHTW